MTIVATSAAEQPHLWQHQLCSLLSKYPIPQRLNSLALDEPLIDGAGIYFEQQQQQSAIDWAKRAPAWLLVAWPFFLTPSYLTKLKASYSRSFSLYLKNQHEKLCWYPPCLLTLLSQLNSIYISACVSAWRWWWEYCWYKARPSPLSDSTPMLLCNQRRNNRHKLATGIQSRAPATMFTLLVDQLPSPCVCTRVERTDGMNT